MEEVGLFSDLKPKVMAPTLRVLQYTANFNIFFST